jgi:hypothetical protein
MAAMRGAMGLAGFDMQRAVISPALCAVLRRDALAAMAAQEIEDSTLGVRLWRLASAALGHSGGLAGTERGDIREPENRAHVRLGMTPEARAALCAALGPGGVLRHSMAEAGLTPAARLVELSVMIVSPGAVEQSVHADVPPHINHPMATMWLALQDVPAVLGPTMVHSTNADQLSEREHWSRELHAAPREPLMTTYGPDGSLEELPPDEAVACLGDNHLSVPQLLAGDVALPMLMDCGDAVLMDTRIFHYGSANTSTTIRAQLRATYAAHRSLLPRCCLQRSLWPCARMGMSAGSRSLFRRRMVRGNRPPVAPWLASHTSCWRSSRGGICCRTF